MWKRSLSSLYKGKSRLRQLAGIDPAEIIMPFTNDKIDKLWEENEPWQRACSKYLGEINNNYPLNKRIQLIKRINLFLFSTIWNTPITGAPIFYTDANKSGKVGYKS